MSLGGKTVLTLARALKGIESQRRLEGDDLLMLIEDIIYKDIPLASMSKERAREYYKEKLKDFKPLPQFGFLKGKTPPEKLMSAVGQGKTPIDTKGLSKKEIKELIDLGFPLRLPTPKGAKLIAREFEQTGRLKKKFKFTDEQKQALAEAKKVSQRKTSPVAVPPIGEAFENLVRPRKAMERFRGGAGQAEAELLDYQARVLHFADKEARKEVIKELREQGMNPVQEQFLISRLLEFGGQGTLRKQQIETAESMFGKQAVRRAERAVIGEGDRTVNYYEGSPSIDIFDEEELAKQGRSGASANPSKLEQRSLAIQEAQGRGVFENPIRKGVIRETMQDIPAPLRPLVFRSLQSPLEERSPKILSQLIGMAERRGVVEGTVDVSSPGKFEMPYVNMADAKSRTVDVSNLKKLPEVQRLMRLGQEFTRRTSAYARRSALDESIEAPFTPSGIVNPQPSFFPAPRDIMSPEKFGLFLGSIGKS